RDGQVLFLDARLRWRMESIDACIAKLDSYIEQATDDTGKARLLNLYGCALDEQKRYQESLPYFERAYQLQPEESMYRKNIAEIHEKMGNTDEAKAWSEGRKN
ncbi:MAG: tetratricopeptide repeat protein, partial [Leptospiraceae bacterium]|nr:tetratricopeptide repeat protein [Leptospiraceae bacterium]